MLSFQGKVDHDAFGFVMLTQKRFISKEMRRKITKIQVSAAAGKEDIILICNDLFM